MKSIDLVINKYWRNFNTPISYSLDLFVSIISTVYVVIPRDKIPVWTLNVGSSMVVETRYAERFSGTFSASVEEHWNGERYAPRMNGIRRKGGVRSEWCVRGDEKGAYPEFTPRHFALALTWLIESWTGNRPFPSSFSAHPPGRWLDALSSTDYIRNGKSNGKGFVCLFLRFDSLLDLRSRRIVRKKKKRKKNKKNKKKIS